MIISLLFLPLVWILALLICGWVLVLRGRREAGLAMCGIGIACVYLLSIAPVADALLQTLEGPYRSVGKGEVWRADTAAVLLGGYEESKLRASQALRIFSIREREDRTKNRTFKVVITGKHVLPSGKELGDEIREYLVERGVPVGAFVEEEGSLTTKENAKNAQKFLGNTPFFLVTSAYHMRRALEEFIALGMNPIPAPAVFRVRGAYTTRDLVPDARNLLYSGLAIHEYVGLLRNRLGR